MPIEINGADEATVGPIRTALKAAALHSPVFTGTPAAPTAAAATNNTQLATTAFVHNALAEAGVGVTTFIALTDVPATYTGQAGKFVAVNAGATALEFVDPPSGGGVDAFIELTDAPATYTGQAGKLVAVNAGATALEFIDAPSGGGDLLAANNLSDLANAATARNNLGLQIGADVQAYSATLTTWAGKAAPGGAVAGTSDAQTLTNKTLGAGTAITLGDDAAGDIWYRDGSGALVRLGIGSSGHVLTVASGVPSWAASGGGGGGLTNWTEAVSTAAPNATVPVVSFAATNAATNVDAALIAKGTGATLAQIPTGSSSGGNKRGDYAVDFSRYNRNAATQVASGLASFIGAGTRNTASGAYAAAVAGQVSVASGTQSFVGAGSSSIASGDNSAVPAGTNNTASGNASLAMGADNLASGENSVATGRYASTRGLFGLHAHGGGRFANTGDAQKGEYVLRRQTADATTTELSLDGGAPAAATRIILPINHAYKFRGQIIARSTGGDVKSWDINGTIKKGLTAGTTAVVGTVTITVKDEDTGASTWTLAVDADTTNGSLRVQGTGAAATTIRWVAEITTVEVG